MMNQDYAEYNPIHHNEASYLTNKSLQQKAKRMAYQRDQVPEFSQSAPQKPINPEIVE